MFPPIARFLTRNFLRNLFAYFDLKHDHVVPEHMCSSNSSGKFVLVILFSEILKHSYFMDMKVFQRNRAHQMKTLLQQSDSRSITAEIRCMWEYAWNLVESRVLILVCFG
ncbi:hypothetical protein AVEN_235753-1 [Araneus ventricosus]|uniref:Uncharacterized protein n=1 Tax=Araneus ventricosus TaxID=182803 RepID=A0A4Y2IPQ5_ARAVE|nr:hypothetical protein AVEN_235753-1 [Araneus ventricosus]